jgi:biotin carboxyl carrier protein
MEQESTPVELELFNVDGSSYKTTLSAKYKLRKSYKIPDPEMITAFIPGNVNDIFVKEKQKVKMGEKLMILVAMKMNNVLIAPFDAVVKKINVKSGDRVPKDHLLIHLKKAGNQKA